MKTIAPHAKKTSMKASSFFPVFLLITAIIAAACGSAPCAAPEGFSRFGCVEFSTVTVESESCLQLDCAERSADGGCKLKECVKTQKSRRVDNMNTGCSRSVDCGKGAYFLPGEPDSPETESSEICDWRPCVETDTATGECSAYKCLSRRISITERTFYSKAACVRIAAYEEEKASSDSAAKHPRQDNSKQSSRQESSAMQTVKDMITATMAYKDERAPGISMEEKALRKAMADGLDARFDFWAISKNILGDYWEELKPAQRREYSSLVAALFRKYRYPQMSQHLNGPANIQIIGERKLKDGGTAVLITYKNADISVAVEYRLRLSNAGWKVYDITSDGESLLTIYRKYQGDIINKNGFPFLISLMRKKLSEPLNP